MPAILAAAAAGVVAAAGLFQGEWWTSRDYGYAYGYDYYDYFGDYAYVGPGGFDWDAQWFPGRAYNYENLAELAAWFRDEAYASYEEALAAAAKTAAAVPDARQLTARGPVVVAGTTPVGVLKRPHVLAAVRTDKFGVVRADLGPPTPALATLKIAEGRELSVSGSVHQARSGPVLLADSAEAGGVMVLIREPAPLRVSGRIVDWADLRAKDADETHRAVLVKTAAGTLAVIVGPQETAEALGVRRGRFLLAEGRLNRVNGKPYFVAYRIRAEG